METSSKDTASKPTFREETGSVDRQKFSYHAKRSGCSSARQRILPLFALLTKKNRSSPSFEQSERMIVDLSMLGRTSDFLCLRWNSRGNAMW